MTQKITTILIAVLFVGAMFAGDALAGQKRAKTGSGTRTTVQTNKGQNNGVCPNGNTPGTGKSTMAGQTKRFGPGNGTGNGDTAPQDGTGFGAITQGKGSTNNPDCDGDGPKGSSKRKGKDD